MMAQKENAAEDWSPMAAAFESETPPGGQPGGGSAGPAGSRLRASRAEGGC